MELDNDKIIFSLIIGLSNFKFEKTYDFIRITKKFKLSLSTTIKDVYQYLTKGKYEIVRNEYAIKVNDKEVRLIKKKMSNAEVIDILIGKFKDIKSKNKKSNERIYELS